MPRRNLHDTLRRSVLMHMHLKNMARIIEQGEFLDQQTLKLMADGSDSDSDSDSSAAGLEQAMLDDLKMLETIESLTSDVQLLEKIKSTRYLRPRPSVLKIGQLELLYDFAQSPADHERFVDMVRVSPRVFRTLLDLIEDDPVFQNNSHVPQTPVDVQLATTLYRMGRYGNGGSCKDIARVLGIGDGTVELFTSRCFDAIERLHPLFVRPLTDDEKEEEKKWMDKHLGYTGGLWREGYLMYDGTIVVLYSKPGQNGQSYYTRKSNYGLNAQIGNTPSNLRIVDYSHGPTGSAHDSSAFEYTAAAKYPNLLFSGNEFAWGDSAYSVSPYMIPIHRRPAADRPENAKFNATLSKLRVRSEHCMGALKGRWQCLRGLRVNINSNSEHVQACRWITIAIILHNMVIDVEGAASGAYFAPPVGSGNGGEDEDDEEALGPDEAEEEGEAKRRHLVQEINTFGR